MANEIRELIKQRKKNEMLEVLFNVASEELRKKDSEIAELREAVKRLVSFGTELLNIDDIDDDEDAATIHSNFNDELIKADKLLGK